MDVAAALDLLLQAARLKWVTRSGWAMRGVPDPESVAEHSWGVAVLALVLAQESGAPLDRGRLLTTALLHDLQEVVTGDIPSPATGYFPPGAKRQAEEAVLTRLLAALTDGERLLDGWREFDGASTAEGRLVRDADRLEMLVQAYLYEESRGSDLAEFWEGQDETLFYSDEARSLYRELCRRRERGS